jgi:hypothetical protein
VKTNRHDARPLAELGRAGLLTVASTFRASHLMFGRRSPRRWSTRTPTLLARHARTRSRRRGAEDVKPFLIVVAVASLLVAAEPRAESGRAGWVGPQEDGPQTSPPGWSETKRQARALSLEGKDLEVVALYEQWVAKHPDFPEGHFRLGGAHESFAGTLVVNRVPDHRPARLKHLEAAAVHMRRGLQLAGPGRSFFMMRALIELHGPIGLDRPAEYERLVRQSVAQYPAEPEAHGYLLGLLADKGEPIGTAARAARAVIPAGPDGRVALASALVVQVGRLGSLTWALAPTLLPEASLLIDEALTLKPDHSSARRIRANIYAMGAMASAPRSADEAVVNSVMRAIAVGQANYALGCGEGYYAPTLAILATPRPGQTDGFVGAHLMPTKGATLLYKDGYRIEMTAEPSPTSPVSCQGVRAGGSAERFFLVARPVEGSRGKAFRIDATGLLTEIK